MEVLSEANRLGCDRADLVAAMGSLAGATWLNPSKCAPAEPVAALQIHGTEDPQVLYEGEAENGGGAELWTVNGEGHVPDFGPAFAESLLDWFTAHAKP